METTILNVSQANSLVDLSQLVHYLSSKLKEVCGNLEELVNVINSPQEIELFAMELAGLMRELRKNNNYHKKYYMGISFQNEQLPFQIVHTVLLWKDLQARDSALEEIG